MGTSTEYFNLIKPDAINNNQSNWANILNANFDKIDNALRQLKICNNTDKPEGSIFYDSGLLKLSGLNGTINQLLTKELADTLYSNNLNNVYFGTQDFSNATITAKNDNRNFLFNLYSRLKSSSGKQEIAFVFGKTKTQEVGTAGNSLGFYFYDGVSEEEIFRLASIRAVFFKELRLKNYGAGITIWDVTNNLNYYRIKSQNGNFTIAYNTATDYGNAVRDKNILQLDNIGRLSIAEATADSHAVTKGQADRLYGKYTNNNVFGDYTLTDTDSFIVTQGDFSWIYLPVATDENYGKQYLISNLGISNDPKATRIKSPNGDQLLLTDGADISVFYLPVGYIASIRCVLSSFSPADILGGGQSYSWLVENIYSSISQEVDSVVITPEQCGAIGDGATDDTYALNTAIVSGKVLCKKNKIYRTTSSLLINNAVEIDLNGSIILADFDGKAIYSDFLSDSNSIIIKNGVIDCNNKSFRGMHINYGGKLTLDNVTIRNVKYSSAYPNAGQSVECLYLNNPAKFTINNSNFLNVVDLTNNRGTTATGSFTINATDGTLTRSTGSFNTDGFQIRDVIFLTGASNTINNTTYYIHSISDSTIWLHSIYGVKPSWLIDETSNITIKQSGGGDTQGAPRHIFIALSRDIPETSIISGCTFDVVKTVDSNGISVAEDADSIHLAGWYSANTTISNNKFTNCENRAIKIQSNKVDILNNKIISPFTTTGKAMGRMISVYGSQVNVRDNKLYGKVITAIDAVQFQNDHNYRDVSIINNIIDAGQDAEYVVGLELTRGIVTSGIDNIHIHMNNIYKFVWGIVSNYSISHPVYYITNNIISDNILEGNVSGIYLGYVNNTGLVVTNNVISGKNLLPYWSNNGDNVPVSAGCGVELLSTNNDGVISENGITQYYIGVKITGVIDQQYFKMQIRNNTFIGMYKSDGQLASDSNGTIKNVGYLDNSTWYDFGTYWRTEQAETSMPSYGYWTVGDFMRSSGSNSVLGWKRKTTGHSNTLGTDWVEIS